MGQRQEAEGGSEELSFPVVENRMCQYLIPEFIEFIVICSVLKAISQQSKLKKDCGAKLKL